MGSGGSKSGLGIRALVFPAAFLFLLLALIFASTGAKDANAAGEAGASCADKTVTVGIVQAKACWTEAAEGKGSVYTARFEDQAVGVDLNGFIVTGRKGGAIRIDSNTNAVTSVSLGDEVDLDLVQLNSIGFPLGQTPVKMGVPAKIDFIAPNVGKMTLEDFRLGTNNGFVRALAGFSPVGNIETPVVLSEGGKGSMNLTISLGGFFTLKGKPQSAQVLLPTEVGKGTRLDGFKIDLAEIDALKVAIIKDFEAEYSADEKKLAAKASAVFPFAGSGKGFTVGVAITDGALSEVDFGDPDLDIPIGEPPAATITALSGAFHVDHSDIEVKADAKADLGPAVPTPFGDISPVQVSAGFDLGHNTKSGFFLKLRGGVKVFRIPVGNAYVDIYFNAGINFGASLGIGFPSFKNNPHDPFYIGAGVDGWFAKGHFQLEGKGTMSLFGAKLLHGDVLVNDRATGACWKVLGLPGGAVFDYSVKKVHTFGVACGIGKYREKFPAGASIAPGNTRTIKLTAEDHILAVRGDDGAPQFTLKSADGRIIKTPTKRDAAIRRNLPERRQNAFFVDQANHKTNVVLPHPAGRWTVTTYPGSAPITSLRAGRVLPKENVRARIVGKGLRRTLVWDSTGNSRTRLAFSEKMAGGLEQPILTTGKARGRYRFRVTKGSHYGKRRLGVVVIHGGTPRRQAVKDRYTVSRPARLAAPRRVNAWRNVHKVTARWAKVRGAHGYLAQMVIKKKGKRAVSFVRRVGPKTRRVVIPGFPGASGGRAIARVSALNVDGKPGEARIRKFRTDPSVTGLATANRISVKSLRASRGAVLLRAICPQNGHCRSRASLTFKGRLIASRSFQQVPDTFRYLRLRPKSKALRRRLNRGRKKGFRVRLRQERAEAGATGSASLSFPQ